MIYLDNAATTSILPCALEAMNNILRHPANPNSSHTLGHEAMYDLIDARERIANCINASPDEIYFTSGATESCHLAMQKLSSVCGIVQVSEVEHHAVLDYKINATKLPRFGLVQMLANNETGEIFSMPKREHANDLIFTDATAAMGHIPIDVKKLNVDMLAAGAHKFGGPCGVGFLYARRGIGVKRSGTPPVALIVAMAEALEWQTEHMAENTEHVCYLFNTVLGSLRRITNMKCNSWIPNGRFDHQLPHILNVSFDGVDGKTLALLCSKRDMMISAGAACTSGNNEPSHVLMAMFRDEARARSAVRISFSHENTVEEVEQAAKIIAECVETLRKIK